jgi:hypothetical protein
MLSSENARWLWERVPAAVKCDEEMCRIWDMAKLLWNSDMAAAYTQLANAGDAYVPNHIFPSL